MILDNKLFLADHAEVKATGIAPNTVDLGVNATFPQRPFYAVLICHGKGAKNLQLKLITSDAKNPTTDYVEMISSGVIDKAGLVRGAVYAVPLPILPSGLTKRYLGAKFVVGGTVDGNGSISDLGHSEEVSITNGVTLSKPALVGAKVVDMNDTYSLVITDQITEYKPWKFLDVMENWDRTNAPAVGSATSDTETTTPTTGA